MSSSCRRLLVYLQVHTCQYFGFRYARTNTHTTLVFIFLLLVFWFFGIIMSMVFFFFLVTRVSRRNNFKTKIVEKSSGAINEWKRDRNVYTELQTLRTHNIRLNITRACTSTIVNAIKITIFDVKWVRTRRNTCAVLACVYTVCTAKRIRCILMDLIFFPLQLLLLFL